MNEDLIIRFDWAAKRMLRDKANFDILESFLSVFLNEKVTVKNIIDYKYDTNSLDSTILIYVSACDAAENNIIVEVQFIRELNYFERNTRFSTLPPVSLDGQHDKVKKIYSISILYFNIGNGNDYLYRGDIPFIGVHTGNDLQVNIKEERAIRTRISLGIPTEYILIRLNEFNKAAATPLEEWMDYLKNEVISPSTTAPGLAKISKRFAYYSLTLQERRAYDKYLDVIMVQNDAIDTAKLEGRIEGRAKALAENKIVRKIARNLKVADVDASIIAATTGLTIEEISSL